MKTKPFLQNQLIAHTESEENLQTKRNPKNSPDEEVFAEPITLNSSKADNLSSAFDLFENMTVGSNSIQDRNRGVTNTKLPDPASSEES